MGKSIRMGMIAGLAALTCAATSGAAVIVVRSSGPSAKSYPPGKAIGDNQAISLKGNDVLVLLDSRGTRTLRGPGQFNASASAAASTSALTALTRQNNHGRVRVQAVRNGPTGASQGRNVWQADVSRAGSVCVANPADLGLYRANASADAQMTLVDQASGRQSAVQFAAGQAIASWPSDLPVKDGDSIRVKAVGSDAVTLKVHMLAPVPQGLEGMAQSFIRNDCQAQLDVLIDTFTSPSAS